MGLTWNLVNMFVVLAVGIVLTYLTNDRSKALRREMDGLRREVAEFKAGVREDIARLEARLDAGLDAVRSDIVQVALAVGAKPRTAQA